MLCDAVGGLLAQAAQFLAHLLVELAPGDAFGDPGLEGAIRSRLLAGPRAATVVVPAAGPAAVVVPAAGPAAGVVSAAGPSAVVPGSPLTTALRAGASAPTVTRRVAVGTVASATFIAIVPPTLIAVPRTVTPVAGAPVTRATLLPGTVIPAIAPLPRTLVPAITRAAAIASAVLGACAASTVGPAVASVRTVARAIGAVRPITLPLAAILTVRTITLPVRTLGARASAPPTVVRALGGFAATVPTRRTTSVLPPRPTPAGGRGRAGPGLATGMRRPSTGRGRALVAPLAAPAVAAVPAVVLAVAVLSHVNRPSLVVSPYAVVSGPA
ncbi:hypothetical protein [Brachybacterium sacelli]|uniref:hypothetical protein n=1 Tax=Brachybacterium sacelli TaxID=173364 RepID=UPI0036214201